MVVGPINWKTCYYPTLLYELGLIRHFTVEEFNLYNSEHLDYDDYILWFANYVKTEFNDNDFLDRWCKKI